MFSKRIAPILHASHRSMVVRARTEHRLRHPFDAREVIMRGKLLATLAKTQGGLMLASIEPSVIRRPLAWLLLVSMDGKGLVESYLVSTRNPLDTPDVYWRVTNKGRNQISTEH